MNLKRTILAASASLGMAAYGVFGIALPAAHAAPRVAGTSCTSASATATIKGGDATPGIDLAPPAMKVIAAATGTVSGCNNGVTGGTVSIPSMTSTNLTCTSGKASGKATISWTGGGTSIGTLNLAATTTPLKFTLKGKVTSGTKFVGSAVSGTFVATPITGNCDTGPTPADLTKASIANSGNFAI